MATFDRSRILLVAAFLLAVSQGCGREDYERAAASGTVHVDDVPLKHGTIFLIPAGKNKGPKAAARITEGRFSLDASQGPVVGQQRVEIFAAEQVNYPLDEPRAARQAGGELLPENPIPRTYNRDSTLTVEVSSDPRRNRFRFRLQTDEAP